MILTKSIDLGVKDMDPQARRVTFAASKFGNVDADGDVITKGAFTKSITERGPASESNRKIKFLRYHDFEHQIGKIVHLEETNEFLVVTAELGNSTKGNDAFLDYKDGIITEHSIGFFEVPEKTFIREDGIRELREVMLLEASAVTFGSNSETPVFNVSKAWDEDQVAKYLAKLNEKIDRLSDALRKGEGSKDRLYSIGCDLHNVKKGYNSLVDFYASGIKPELEIKEPNKTDLASEFYKHLINLNK